MDIVKRIDDLRIAKGWSFYKLAQECGLSQQTFTKWKDGHTMPTIPALELVCNAFGITLSEFFDESGQHNTAPTALANWERLSMEERYSIELIIQNYLKNKS